MKRPSTSLALLCLTLAAAPAHAGYAGATWGMTPQQVASSDPAIKVVKDEKGKRIEGKLRLAAGQTTMDGVSYQLDYYFDPASKTLVAINFAPPAEQCDAARQAHAAKFGAPHEDRKEIAVGSGQPPMVQIESEWNGSAALEGDRISGVDVSVDKMGIRYCQFLRSK